MTQDEKILTGNGYRVGIRSRLLKDTNQPRMAEFNGLYAIDDPNDDEDGFCIVGDDKQKIIAEAMEYFEGFLS